jgi:hypothetical protein
MTLSPEQISPLVRPRTLDLSGFRHLEPSSAPLHKRSRRAMECSRRCAVRTWAGVVCKVSLF